MKTYDTLAEVRVDHEIAGLHWFESAPHATADIVGDLNKSRFVISRSGHRFDIWALAAHADRTLPDGMEAPTFVLVGTEPSFALAAEYVRDARLPAEASPTSDQLPTSELES